MRFRLRSVDASFLETAPWRFVTAGERFSFNATHATAPPFRALAEDYLLEDLAPGRCRFTYTVAIEPGLLGRLLSPVLRGSLDRQFSAAAHALTRYVRDRT